MHEYLIRAEDGDFLVPRKDSLLALGVAAGEGWQQCEGWGDLRIKRGDNEISVCCEDAGVQVAVEGPISRDEADAIAERLSLHLSHSEGRQTRVVPLN